MIVPILETLFLPIREEEGGGGGGGRFSWYGRFLEKIEQQPATERTSACIEAG